jgi:hypothetical protein
MLAVPRVMCGVIEPEEVHSAYSSCPFTLLAMDGIVKVIGLVPAVMVGTAVPALAKFTMKSLTAEVVMLPQAALFEPLVEVAPAALLHEVSQLKSPLHSKNTPPT